jgi:hypothetical protein
MIYKNGYKGELTMKYNDLRKLLNSDDKELINKIVEKDGFSFNENVILDQLDNYDERDSEEIREDARKFGCIIRGNNEVIVPAGLRFNISKSNDSFTPVLFYIERNNVELPLFYMEDNEDIAVTFTSFGQKLFTYANSVFTSIADAYEQLCIIEQLFGVKITE